MFHLYKNIQTDFQGQIFLELFQFKTRSHFWDTLYVYICYGVLFCLVQVLNVSISKYTQEVYEVMSALSCSTNLTFF